MKNETLHKNEVKSLYLPLYTIFNAVPFLCRIIFIMICSLPVRPLDLSILQTNKKHGKRMSEKQEKEKQRLRDK